VIVGAAPGQQRSVAVAENGTVTQLLQVYTVRFVAWIEMQLVSQFGSRSTVTVM